MLDLNTLTSAQRKAVDTNSARNNNIDKPVSLFRANSTVTQNLTSAGWVSPENGQFTDEALDVLGLPSRLAREIEAAHRAAINEDGARVIKRLEFDYARALVGKRVTLDGVWGTVTQLAEPHPTRNFEQVVVMWDNGETELRAATPLVSPDVAIPFGLLITHSYRPLFTRKGGRVLTVEYMATEKLRYLGMVHASETARGATVITMDEYGTLQGLHLSLAHPVQVTLTGTGYNVRGTYYGVRFGGYRMQLEFAFPVTYRDDTLLRANEYVTVEIGDPERVGGRVQVQAFSGNCAVTLEMLADIQKCVKLAQHADATFPTDL